MRTFESNCLSAQLSQWFLSRKSKAVFEKKYLTRLVKKTPVHHSSKSNSAKMNGRIYLFKNNVDLYLSPQEAQCIRELLKGLTYQKIGDALGISERTVEGYLQNVRKRCRCKDRKNLVEFIRKSDFLRVYSLDT